jgi:hypothetical protein
MHTTAANLAAAWADRAEEAAATLRHAEAAPGLFRPDHVALLRDDLARAVKQARFWETRAVADAKADR